MTYLRKGFNFVSLKCHPGGMFIRLIEQEELSKPPSQPMYTAWTQAQDLETAPSLLKLRMSGVWPSERRNTDAMVRVSTMAPHIKAQSSLNGPTEKEGCTLCHVPSCFYKQLLHCGRLPWSPLPPSLKKPFLRTITVPTLYFPSFSDEPRVSHCSSGMTNGAEQWSTYSSNYRDFSPGFLGTESSLPTPILQYTWFGASSKLDLSWMYRYSRYTF